MFNLEHLQTIRAAELRKLITRLPAKGARVLEIGAGTGQQAAAIAAAGFDVAAIEIPSSNYKEARVFPIADYDGRHIPFPDHSFDVVFSSNVLEHVPDLTIMNREIGRVLKPDGYCVHIMPTHAWRFWTTLTSFPTAIQYAWTLRRQLLPSRSSLTRSGIRALAKAWLTAGVRLAQPFFQRRHGERGNIVSELWLFHPGWWRRSFNQNGFEVIRDEPMGLFYTGNMLLGQELSIARRERLAESLGSACHLFEVRPSHAVRGAERVVEVTTARGRTLIPGDCQVGLRLPCW